MNSLHSEFRDRAEFKLVYIAEAHASDEWPISSGRYTTDGRPVTLTQPKTAEERIAAAVRYQAEYAITLPIFVDPPLPAQPEAAAAEPRPEREGGADGSDGAFEAVYAPWPLRFYGAEAREEGGEENWTLSFIATPSECEYSLAELRAWLLQALNGGESEADGDDGDEVVQRTDTE